jgi:hypothetical protein
MKITWKQRTFMGMCIVHIQNFHLSIVRSDNRNDFPQFAVIQFVRWARMNFFPIHRLFLGLV